MHTLVLLRHGESQSNQDNLFTGWSDVDLTEKGAKEAKNSGILLKKHNYQFDKIFTSVLKRAVKTMDLCLNEIEQNNIPIVYDWRLNEQHYGDLEGLNKSETVKLHGEEKVFNWRRSFNVSPPPLALNDKRHPRFDNRYKKLSDEEIPSTESLKDTLNRLLPIWNQDIAPFIKSGKNALIVAHGNSLRALIKYLNNISDEDISNFNIPTGIPLVLRLNNDLNTTQFFFLDS
jgi:2,3-bisphosphoglycerate-dependent phosphoglycerate mutase